MAVNEDFLRFIIDQLSDSGPFETKKMFGGIGFFKDGHMFGMIGGDKFRLKVDETNQKDFEDLGMKPYHDMTKKKGMPYWEVPVDVLENKTLIKKWVNKAFAVAVNARKR